MMKARGYTKKRCYALECGYHNKTTRTQRLSYHAYIVDLVKDGKVDTLRKLLSTGLSSNPANVHGEGLINLVCRLGNSAILKVMIDAGCDVQVSDDYGRTPLHDVCCATQPSCTLLFHMKISYILPSIHDSNNFLRYDHRVCS
jgi:ankyrin repeat protein